MARRYGADAYPGFTSDAIVTGNLGGPHRSQVAHMCRYGRLPDRGVASFFSS